MRVTKVFKALARFMQKSKLIWLILTGLILVIFYSCTMTSAAEKVASNNQDDALLTDPFLQLPTETTVNVVWFTEFSGDRHWVKYGLQLEQEAEAHTTKLSRVREDQESQITNPPAKPTFRDIWRHEATVRKLVPNQSLPYQVISTNGQDRAISSVFSLASAPAKNTPLKILLTSDHQLMPMTSANLEQVTKTLDTIDAVFFPGDLVNVPDRASEWFDDLRGGAFFPCLQGRANYQLDSEGIKTIYSGGAIIQNAPLFPAIGNHEVMGQFGQSSFNTLKQEFNQPLPRKVAEGAYHAQALEINPHNDPQLKADWIKNNSFNTDTYEEIFSLPESDNGGKRYYTTTFGDIRLISLYVTNIWRKPGLAAEEQGRYKESSANLTSQQNWGYGQHIFESIAKDSEQYQWLEREVAGEAFQAAKYKIVMLHHPPHTLGGNIVPPYTDPQPKLDYTAEGNVRSRHYDYPIKADYIIRDLIPLLESVGVQLVYYGHSHLWNRFESDSGMHFLESSNVGNSYGAHFAANNPRPIPAYSPQNFAAIGNPNGLPPMMPNLAPLVDESAQPLPYIASNDMTVFSIFDTHTGTVSSYRYDIRQPKSAAVKFDQFKLRR